jgi:hypothetical protein
MRRTLSVIVVLATLALTPQAFACVRRSTMTAA